MVIENLKKSLAAGLLISIGATVKLSCENPVIGAIFFAIGLFFICSMGMNLFTGKIGYINKLNLRDYPLIWIGNLVGCIISMLLVRFARPELTEKVTPMMNAKFEMSILRIAVLAFFCGVLMYLAVDNFKKYGSGSFGLFGIIIGVVVFILSGFEHSIANMAYSVLYVSDLHGLWKCLELIVVSTVFNGLGSLAIKFLLIGVKKKEA